MSLKEQTGAVQLGQSLSEALATLPDKDLQRLIMVLAECSGRISDLCRGTLTQKTSTQNVFGDEQLALDVAADKVLMDALRESGVVCVASSEETPEEVHMNDDASLSVAFDPLDGSSIVGSNWAVGTIVGIWRAKALVGVSGESMVASVVTTYGPRTTLYVAAEGMRVVELTRSLDGAWSVSLIPGDIGEGKLFAPANLRAARLMEGYKRLVQWWMDEGYTLRYTGGMVPDVAQILVKGYGVFASPACEGARAKLRVLYEVMPIAYLVEKCGGKSTDGNGSVLRRVVKACDERSAACVGSRGEVDRFEKYCGSGGEMA